MKRKLMTTTRVIMLGFFLGAMLGSLLLYLPVSLRQGMHIKYIDALFVSVSGMCVTGLSTVNIEATFSWFGQVVLLILIQMGGLGIVTFTTVVFVTFQKRITLTDRMLMQSAYNLDTLSGLVGMTLRIVCATISIELIGALLYAIVFVPQYGAAGIWYALFHAVSAFCNAGIDLLGGNSLCAYRDNIWINLTTMFLIVAGGLGFPVYWELARRFHIRRKKKTGESRMSFHARLVIVVTAILLVAGTLFTLILEYDNPQTLGDLPFPQKLLVSMFQSVTLRTAGFATIDQSGFTSASCMLYLLLMFIGGSPAGTAGGVKTVTVTLLLASVLANIRGEKEVSIMHRKITDTIIRRCVAIIIFSLTVLFVLTGLLLAIEPYDFLDTLYEMTSAIATVGLSRGMTATLGTAGKLIVALAMYLGRIGPITLALAFNSNKSSSALSYPEGKVIIG